MSFPQSVTPTAHRRLMLQEESASDWLEERGLHAEGSRGLRLYADEFKTTGFRLARVWHTEVALKVTPPNDSTLIMAQMEGEFAPMSPADWTFPSFQSTIRAILTGLLLEGLEAEILVPGSLGSLFQRAHQEILLNASNRSFSATDLPDELRVSSSYLRRAFAAHGTTAAQMIRNVRAATARDYLAHGDHSLSREDIARLSGFRSVRAMSQALNSPALGRSGSAKLLVQRG